MKLHQCKTFYLHSPTLVYTQSTERILTHLFCKKGQKKIPPNFNWDQKLKNHLTLEELANCSTNMYCLEQSVSVISVVYHRNMPAMIYHKIVVMSHLTSENMWTMILCWLVMIAFYGWLHRLVIFGFNLKIDSSFGEIILISYLYHNHLMLPVIQILEACDFWWGKKRTLNPGRTHPRKCLAWINFLQLFEDELKPLFFNQGKKWYAFFQVRFLTFIGKAVNKVKCNGGVFFLLAVFHCHSYALQQMWSKAFYCISSCLRRY